MLPGHTEMASRRFQIRYIIVEVGLTVKTELRF